MQQQQQLLVGRLVLLADVENDTIEVYIKRSVTIVVDVKVEVEVEVG